MFKNLFSESQFLNIWFAS